MSSAQPFQEPFLNQAAIEAEYLANWQALPANRLGRHPFVTIWTNAPAGTNIRLWVRAESSDDGVAHWAPHPDGVATIPDRATTEGDEMAPPMRYLLGNAWSGLLVSADSSDETMQVYLTTSEV